MSGVRVLSVGQCGVDHGSISWALQSAFGAEVVSAHSAQEALEKLKKDTFALVLVNRVFDRDGDSGVEFIRQVKAEEGLKETPVMLVSNYEDAQEQARAAGAVPGFGKAALGQASTREKLAPYLGKTLASGGR